MDFKDILTNIIEKFNNAYGVFLMGSDGIPIEKIIKNDLANIEVLAAEYANFLKLTANSLNEIQAGQINEIINITDNLLILLYSLTTEYFLFLVLPFDSNLGRARFELKKAKYILQKELF